MTQKPLDDIRALIAGLPGPDEQARAAAAAAIAEPGSLGRLEEIALWLAAWSGKPAPQIRRPILALYAGAPGPGRLDAAEAVRERLEAVAAGRAAVNALAAGAGAGLEAFDLAIDRPIGEAATAPTLTERECAATMAFGMEVLAKTPDLLLLGDIAPSESIGAAALGHALFGGEPGDWSPDQAEAVGAAVARARRETADPLELLRQLGGREMAAAAGAILAARGQKIPVILDGFGVCAAAAALRAAAPGAVAHCLVASGPPRLLAAMGLSPLVDLGIEPAEGTGGLAALSMVKLSCSILDTGR